MAHALWKLHQASHLIGSCSCTSRKVRPEAEAPASAARAAASPLLSRAPSARSCCSSFSDSERPVPSYLRWHYP